MIHPSETWMDDGACRNTTIDFFPTNGHHLLTRPAKEICNTCPVQMDCLDYALIHAIDHGVWGGTDEKERRRIRKSRSRENRLRLAQSPDDTAHSAHG